MRDCEKTALFSCVALDFSAVLIAVGALLIEVFVCTLSCHNSSSLCPVLFLVVWVGSWVGLGRGSEVGDCKKTEACLFHIETSQSVTFRLLVTLLLKPGPDCLQAKLNTSNLFAGGCALACCD